MTTSCHRRTSPSYQQNHFVHQNRFSVDKPHQSNHFAHQTGIPVDRLWQIRKEEISCRTMESE